MDEPAGATGTRARVLIVEDDRAMVGLLAMLLGNQDCEVQVAYDGATALRRHAEERPDAVILDLSLPDMPGEEVCREILARGGTAVLVVSGRHDERDVTRLLDLGADDYVTKPFRHDELISRIRAAMRRRPRSARERGRIVVDGLVVDTARHDVVSHGRPLRLSPIEFRLLEQLARREGEVVTHAELAAAAWPDSGENGPALLKPHVARLRRKLASGGAPIPRSVRGLGYQLR